ncbi:MAG: type I methionyl aminopeptidase [Proteobacteria bacterium]|nr:type I methionyl aminopeptidase [Pseudomonadota bacterium]
MIVPKSDREIKIMRESNQIVKEVLNELSLRAEEGITTLELNRLAEKKIRKQGATPAFLGYRDYPFTICASINEEVVHGFPSKRRLQDGDIISIDVGVCFQGYYGDAAVTVPVGEVSEQALRLIAVTRESLDLAIEKVQVGNRIFDISAVIQDRVESEGFSVVRDFVGHGIGQKLHEEPQIPNFRMDEGSSQIKIKPGMVIAIEPMVNIGSYEVDTLPDGWTVVTRDRSLSAHFEHTVAATANGPMVLSA